MNDREIKHQIKLREWTDLINARNESGLSIEAWCSQNGTNINQYYYWLKRVRQASFTTIESACNNPGSIQPGSVPSFTKVELSSNTSSVGGININVRGASISIAPNACDEHVRMVLEALLHA